METERITVEPSRLCRACGAERSHMFPLFVRDREDGLRLDDMLMACTDLKIHVADGLPSSICYSCADELKASYRFKQRCETTDQYFNELGLKSNEIKQELETVIFKEGEIENLLELNEELDTNANSSSLSFEEVTEGISEEVIISREVKQEQGDLTITETIVYKQEENFSEVTEDEAIRVGNLEDSPPNEDLRFKDFTNKKENRNVVSEGAENEFPLRSKEQKEEASSSKDDDSDYIPKEKLWKSSRLGLKSNEIKQEQEIIVFKEGENENLLELKREIDTDDNSSSSSFKEGISEAAVILRETKREQDLLTVTETTVYQQEENFSEVTEDESIRVGNLEDSLPNEDLRFEDLPNKKENRNVVSEGAENEFLLRSKEQKGEEMIHDGSSQASSSKDDDSDYIPMEKLWKSSRLGLKSNEIKQEQEIIVFKEGENENLLELKQEIDTDDNSSSSSFKEGISEAAVILRETKQEQGDLLTITETTIYKQEENFSDVTEDESIRVDNLEDSLPNEGLCFEDFPNKEENRNVSKTAENGELPSGSKEQKEEETIRDDSSEASSSEDDDSDYTPNEKLRKSSRLGNFEKYTHKQTHENGERKRFKCDVCGKSYSTKKYLQQHKKRHANGGQRCFKCDICEKLYCTTAYLRKHKKTHEHGERKYYKCDVCEKSYCTTAYLREHKKTHENGGRKRFKCDICKKSFTLSRYLREHEKTHETGGRKRFKCDICEKSFTLSRYLRVHKLTHENGGEKPFKCETCDKSFAISKYLQRHKKMHEKNVFYEQKRMKNVSVITNSFLILDGNFIL